MEGRLHYINQINDQLSWLATRVASGNRDNRQDMNIMAETALCGLLNRMYGWDLVNANRIRQNFPGVDLVDMDQCVAVQVTSTNTVAKVAHTLEAYERNGLEKWFDRLIVVTLTFDEPTKGMQKLEQPPFFQGGRDIWNMQYLLRALEDREISALKEIADYLDEELGLGTKRAGAQPGHPLPRVPMALPGFVEGSRDRELEILESCLSKGEPVFIWGLGGIGKTQVAMKLAQRWRGDAYIMRYAQNLAPGQDGMRETILQADFAGFRFNGEDTSDRSVEFARRMAFLRRDYAGAMIIIDGFDRPRRTFENLTMGVYQEFETLARAGVQLVFTTRSYPEGRPGCEIRPLAEAHLLQLMKDVLTDDKLPEEELLELIRAVEGHTLTVDLMAKTLKRSWGRVSPRMMLRALGSSMDREDFPEVLRDRNESQRRIYGHLCDLFTLSGMSESERAVMRCAALLPEDGMDKRIFSDALDDRKPQVRRRFYDRFLPRKRRAAEEAAVSQREACVDLTRTGWLDVDDTGRLTIHPVIRTVCRGEVPPDYDSCKRFLDTLLHRFVKTDDNKEERFRELLELFTNAKNTLSDGREWCVGLIGDLWAAVDEDKLDLYHAQRLVELWENADPAEPQALAAAYENLAGVCFRIREYSRALAAYQAAMAIWEEDPPENPRTLARIHGLASDICRKALRYQDALDYRLKSVALWESLLEPDGVELSKYYLKLAGDYSELGQYQTALSWCRRVCAIRQTHLRQLDGENIPAYQLTAQVLMELGSYEEARQYAEKALDIAERILPSNSTVLAAIYETIQVCCLYLQRHEEALNYGEKSLRIRMWRQDQEGIANSYHNLASSHNALRDKRMALDYLLRAMEIQEKLLPAGHPSLATTYNRLGDVYSDLGDHRKFLEYMQKALSIREKVLPADHPDLAISYENLGAAYDNLGDYAKKMEYLRKGHAIFEKMLPAGHPHLAASYINMGAAYRQLGDGEKAVEYMLKALEIQERVLPHDHPDLPRTYNNLGNICLDMDDHDKAEAYFRKALTVGEAVFPADHPNMGLYLNNLGGLHAARDDHGKALEYQLRAAGIFEKNLPSRQLYLASAYRNIGISYDHLDDREQALEYFLKALEIWEEALPPEHPDVVRIRRNVGKAYERLGAYDKALEYTQSVRLIYEKTLPPDDLKLASVYNKLAVFHSELQQYRQTLECLEKAQGIFEKALPPDHPNLAVIRQNIETVRAELE